MEKAEKAGKEKVEGKVAGEAEKGKAKGKEKGEGEGKKRKSNEAKKGKSAGVETGVEKGEKKEASKNKAKGKENKTLASKEPRLLEMYRKNIVPNMLKEGLYNNVMRAPKLTKIVINIGVGKAIDNKKLLDNAIEELSRITGQKPIKTLAKKSIANFKLREGNAIGCKVTLRGKRMYEFLDRLINASLPRIRDFRGLSSKSFDGRGQYSLGVKEQIIFPEIDYDKIEKISGMNITFITTARSDSEAHDMLKRFSFPFRN